MKLEPLKGALAGVTARPEWQRQQQFEALCRQWPALVGAAVAARTRPLGVRQGVLQVAVSHGTWAQTLTFERRRILKKIQDAVPSPLVQGLGDIQFSTARWHEAPPAIAGPLATPSESPQAPSLPATTAAPQPTPTPTPTPTTPPAPPRPSAGEAFARWAARQRARSQDFPTCPRCQCPAPPSDLGRWGVCGACMRQEWAAAGSPLGTYHRPADPPP